MGYLNVIDPFNNKAKYSFDFDSGEGDTDNKRFTVYKLYDTETWVLHTKEIFNT